MTVRVVPRADHPISRRKIDADALKVLYRLHRHGHVAYLVGGGVRDLLLDRRPKDFDVVTDAHPGQVKRLFRNSWIIGRRFKLVHVVFGKNVIEVATFRAKAPSDGSGRSSDAVRNPADSPSSRGLLVTRENTFGTPEQDAMRRDFTINGLFYDIATFSIIDYPGGLADLQRRMIRTIGDPHIRFQEDPVRMMRAVKFATRLDLRLEKKTRAAIRAHAEAITWCAPPRILEENLRLVGSGCARASFQMLSDLGLMGHLFPEVHEALRGPSDSFWETLGLLDQWVNDGEYVTRALQLAILLFPVVRDHVFESGPRMESPGEHVNNTIRPICQRMRITKADTARIIQIYLAQRRCLRPKGRRFSLSAFMRRGYFRDALRLFRLHVITTGIPTDVLDAWRQRLEDAPEVSSPAPGGDGAGRTGSRGRHRRRRRRRKRAGRSA